jgi:nucleotide-binding universal stress UspA family protein
MVIEGIRDIYGLEMAAHADSQTVEEVVKAEDATLQGLLASASELARASGVTLRAEQVDGDVVDGIIGAVNRNGADLLIVGLRHHAGLIERLFPQTAHTLTERAPCSVLGVR